MYRRVLEHGWVVVSLDPEIIMHQTTKRYLGMYIFDSKMIM